MLGASLAGLLTAAALGSAGWTVTLLERDALTDRPEPRPGVPQGHQPHVLLYRGLSAIEELLPGLRWELIVAGGVPLDTGDLAWLGEQGWAPFGTPAFELVSATRPLVEHVVRQRVKALPGVQLHSGTRVSGLRRPAGGTGWVVECPGNAPLTAELVVDASGRGSRLPIWLARSGFGEVATTIVDARVGYASRVYSAPADHLGPVAGILMLLTPQSPCGGVALPVEGGNWMVAAVGAGDRRPPRDAAGFDAFLGRLRDPALADFARSARPVGDIVVHRRTGNVRHYYDRMKNWPTGLLVVGDASCAFNPVYGQGIAVAACQALLLRKALPSVSGLRPGWERRLMRRLARAAELPWAIATGEDLRYTDSESGRSPIDALFGRWSHELDRLAVHGDLRAQRTLDRIYHLVGSPAGMFHPALIASAARARLFGLPTPVPRPPLGDHSRQTTAR
ncbi:NAD(P)/FAD-dependent oxidoreductase [Streptomyces himalayensis]|uniref:NAD(P)/FAD-dependent oxidoreductase n=1 Tax=Streptomyces himalayensis TaxID=2820085 RepID=UPI0028A8AFF6|nr:FAD-binding protein [Streptomyces himalayensis]